MEETLYLMWRFIKQTKKRSLRVCDTDRKRASKVNGEVSFKAEEKEKNPV